jgi:hypothetical protein
MIGRDKRIKLLDFNVARKWNKETEVMMTVTGAPLY